MSARVVELLRPVPPPMRPAEIAWAQAEEVCQVLAHLVQQHADVTSIEITMGHLARRLREAEGLEP